MKNTNKQLKIGALALMAGLHSTGAVAETQNGEAIANVITPLTITNLLAMNFGDVASGSLGGDITMAAGGGMTVTSGDADIIGATTGTPLTFDIYTDIEPISTIS